MALSLLRRDVFAGGIFVLSGMYFSLEALTYEIGTAFRMGPGFMPVMLGVVLLLLGAAIILNALRKTDEEENPQPVAWRGIILILGNIIFFGACIRGLGFVPVVLISAFVSAMASRLNSPMFSAIVAVSLVVLCALIFKVGLGFQVPWFGPWLGM
jgi:hypothetical protein